ncbi:two-component system LytT family sensor kinase [Microbacterium sp. SORGH_AS 1204]|uniref:sensor histidine kinase n=1 Tax=Microbacterium sp. SORGH_AS_1204 TaxID=3041785 RepID=UPI00278DC7D2|nr:histidine kinase [Microbacterium sp. SORGH_AS_1204]MDQ1138135.1 two-component system LytT family sensor kinase [Microbacterium sp. SORGH_AS_1204]
MLDAPLLAGAAGVVVGVALTLVLVYARRFALAPRDLGSDAERATHRTLHVAAAAAAALRGGRDEPDAARAAKHLRVLLAADAVAIVESGTDRVAVDGPEALAGPARRIAARVYESGRRQVFSEAREAAVGAPIVVDGRVWGAVVAFAADVRAPLVRATGDVADWCAAQIELAGLDASRAALAEAELRALRAQISPHFIYNALTAIASFISTDPPRARDLVLEFADFTRYSFRRQGEFTTLSEELRSIHSYLELERARFGDRLTVRLRIAPETLATVIPFLSVQPLVENAVRHGLERRERGGVLTVTSIDDGTHTEVIVDDDGVGMDPDELATLLDLDAPASHVGLRNVDARLRQLYGPGGGLVIETNVGSGTSVRLRVPKSQPQHETARA